VSTLGLIVIGTWSSTVIMKNGKPQNPSALSARVETVAEYFRATNL